LKIGNSDAEKLVLSSGKLYFYSEVVVPHVRVASGLLNWIFLIHLGHGQDWNS